MSERSDSGRKYGCAGCTKPDAADNVVQCDACGAWWHFSCAGVTESVSDRSWICIQCQPPSKPPSRTSTRASVVSRSSSNLTDSMARLRERQDLERQRAEIEMEKKFLKEQQRLLEEAIATEEEKRSRSRVSREDSLKRVQEWIGNSADPPPSAANQTPAASVDQQQNPNPAQIDSATEAEGGTEDDLPLEPSSNLNIPIHSSPLRDRTLPTFDTTGNVSDLLPPPPIDAEAHQKTVDLARDLRARLELCLEESESTLPRFADLEHQLKICRKEMEEMHSIAHRLTTMPSSATDGTAETKNDVESGAGAIGTLSKQLTGECHASEIQIDNANKYNAPLPISLSTLQQNEQQRIAHALSYLINNNFLLPNQIASQSTPFPLALTQPTPPPQPGQQSTALHLKQPPPLPQLSGQLPLVQQPFLLQPLVEKLSVQQPTVPQLPVEQPTGSQLPVQQPMVPQLPVQQPTGPQLPVQQPMVPPPTVREPPVQQPADPKQLQRPPMPKPPAQRPPVPKLPVQPPKQPPMQHPPMQPPVQKPPKQSPIQQHPVQQPPIQHPPMQPPVQKPPKQPPIQQHPVQQPPMQQYPVQQPPMQQPPIQQYPVQQPLMQQPPVQQPPAQQPPMQHIPWQQPPVHQFPLYPPFAQPPPMYYAPPMIYPPIQQVPTPYVPEQCPPDPYPASEQPPLRQSPMQHPPGPQPPMPYPAEEQPPLNDSPEEPEEQRGQLPTPQQLTSRQSLSRDLPTFSGDPAEWPIFISNFEYTTRTCGYTHGENMIRLQKCLRGRALDSVRSRLVFPAAVPQVIETLRMRYGRPELLINVLLQKVRAMPAPRGDKLEALIEYGLAVQELCDHIEAANERAHLSNPTLLHELVGKLPADQKLMWAGFKRGLPAVDLRTFSEYMTGVMQDASSVVLYESDSRKTHGKEKTKAYVNSHGTKSDEATTSTTATTQSKCNRCLHCEKEGHKLRDCYSFKALSIDDRWRRIRALSLCHICLFGHGRRACRSNNKCDISECQFKHHPLLHGKSTAPTLQVANSNTHQLLDSGVLFRILPVTLYGKSGKINTFAFIDEGSSLTLVESKLVKQLGLAGDPRPLCMLWTGNTSRVEKESQTVTISISGAEQQRHYQLLNARTVQNLDLPMQSFDIEESAKRFAYLKQLPIQSYHNVRPKILIGLDNLKLGVPLKTREGDGSGPIAVKTRLGWCVYGRQEPKATEGFSFHICGCTSNDELHETVKQFIAVEENGIKQLGSSLSAEEQRAQELLEKTTKRVGRHFETGLLWAEDDVELPDSYGMALQRHKCLQRRMDRNPALRENISRQIKEYVEKGYAHRATHAELDEANPRKVWYLPLGAVTNPNKPGKIRLIWDAAAKAAGVSLNSVLLKGPDQLTLLPAVLFRFRLFCVAVSADIEQMFHQLAMILSDKNSLRFLWSETSDGTVEIYLMDVATFGATCSPASAQYVKNLNAKEHIQQYPRAVEAILKSHYVDDYLDSFGTEAEAEEVSADVRLVHHNGGFHLRNWRSNSEKVVNALGEPATADSKNMNLDGGEQVERILGMLWSPRSDEFSFSTRMSEEVRTLLDSNTRPTKRQVLRCVMSLFDPLGLLAPFIIHGKVLIQELWRAGTEWDEAVGDEVFEHWIRWTKMIEFISTVRIPRCYFPRATETTYKDAQLHVFVDASEIAYSCAAYIRTTLGEGVYDCVLIAGKSKVAPLKPMSIPRLELQGCVLGTRLLKFVEENHPIAFSKKVLWTDSTTARSWIRSDPRRYKPFVAHRVGEILESTDVNEWRWVPSKQNPADEATKWGRGPYFSTESQWFKGPDFLRRPEGEWPKTTDSVETTTEDVRASVLFHFAAEPILDFERYSTWKRMLRTTAYVRRFLFNIANPEQKLLGLLSQAELLGAERMIFKLVQRESYPDEIATLGRIQPESGNNSTCLDRKSQLFEMRPALDDAGLLRQRSRIINAKDVPYETRYPIILPSKHRAVILLIDEYHRRYRHANNETVSNELRQRFTISNLRRLVRKVADRCQLCKIRKARPENPPMAPLHQSRLAVSVRPFTYVGLDYFGPFLTKVGRSNVKRWVALFTCLTVRAVHLEVAYILSTASCISCVRRFISRRGSPAEIYSDNGTNFQGAERILREQIDNELSVTFTSTTTKWSFIPPGAPHMGGAWERLVRSVKVAMKDAYSEGKLTDEELLTLIAEAESIVNSRPLTYLPLDSEESEALTPNHFLLGTSSGAKLACVDIGASQKHLKDIWGGIQEQLDRFWQRFLVEYMPVIRRQPKWFNDTKPLQVGDLVLVVDGDKRNEWSRGKVVQIFPGCDGKVRQALVETRQKTFRRPTSRLAVLDVGVRGAIPEDDGTHRGEDVTAGTSELVTLRQPDSPYACRDLTLH